MTPSPFGPAFGFVVIVLLSSVCMPFVHGFLLTTQQSPNVGQVGCRVITGARGGANTKVNSGAVESEDYVEYQRPDCRELRLHTWQEVEKYIDDLREKEEPIPIIVPVGSTEQHGPTGLIGTDDITAEATARGLAAATGAMLSPSIPVGMAMHHTGFPGSISLRPSTFVSVIKDHVYSFKKSGFTHVLFVNGHGGNIMPIYKAFKDLAEELGEDCPALRVASWYYGPNVSAMVRGMYNDSLGSHATPDEVALTQHLFPEHIKIAELQEAAIKENGRLGGNITRVLEEESGLRFMDPEDFRRRYPDGRMGSRPQLATPAAGAAILRRAVGDLVEAYAAFLAPPPPPPPPAAEDAEAEEGGAAEEEEEAAAAAAAPAAPPLM